jgi:hypothetical protein
MTDYNLRETHMRKGYGDSIKIWVDTGHNSAGNGGDTYYSGGSFNNHPTSTIDQDNKIEKAHVDYDVHQTNKVWLDQSQNVNIGSGNYGGDNNTAYGGDVMIVLDHVHV